MTQTQTTSVASKDERRREAFNALITELHVCRKVAIAPDRLSGILKMLNKDNYTYDQFQRARVWILYGDWSRKGFDPTLELSDFYPTADQYEEAKAKVSDQGILVFTKDQLKQHDRRVYLEGFTAGQARKQLEEVAKQEVGHGQPLRSKIEDALVELYGAKQA